MSGAPDDGPSDPYVEWIRRWRAARERSLRRPEGWLTLAGLFWVDAGIHRVGSDPGCDVVLPRGPAFAGHLEVSGGGGAFRAEPGAGVTASGNPVTEVAMADDRQGRPTTLSVESVTFHLIERDGALAVRVRDPDGFAVRGFHGLDHFPVDPRWRVRAAFEPDEPGRQIRAPNVLGVGEDRRVLGTLSFEVDGKPLALLALEDASNGGLFVVFGDATNGTATYGGGRYLYPGPPTPDGVVDLDFNRAINPPCAFTPYATCVLPVPENVLPVAIEAGERVYRPA